MINRISMDAIDLSLAKTIWSTDNIFRVWLMHYKVAVLSGDFQLIE